MNEMMNEVEDFGIEDRTYRDHEDGTIWSWYYMTIGGKPRFVVSNDVYTDVPQCIISYNFFYDMNGNLVNVKRIAWRTFQKRGEL